MFVALQYIQVILLLFEIGCSIPTSLVLSNPGSAAKRPLAVALSNQLSLNISLTGSKNITNATLGPASLAFSDSNVTTLSNYIPYKVPNTKVSLELHSFGSALAPKEVIFTIAPALSKVIRYCIMGGGDKPIILGFFRYTHEFDSGHTTRFNVADFREDGRPMTWNILSDTLKGLTDFMKQPDQGYTEVSFEVEEEGVGYVGTGYLELVPSPKPTVF